MSKLTNAVLARVYRSEESQIRRWKRDKAPLTNVAEMLVWFASRRYSPAALKNLSDDEVAAMQAQIDAVLPPPEPTSRERKAPKVAALEGLKGAQHALRRLEEEEERLHRQMVEAEGNMVREAAIRKQWRETLLSLKQFDVLVEAGRRDTGEMMTRAQLVPMLTMIAVWLRRGVEEFLNSICLQIAEMDKPEQVSALIAAAIRQSVGNAVNAATNDGKLPGWVRLALEEGL